MLTPVPQPFLLTSLFPSSSSARPFLTGLTAGFSMRNFQSTDDPNASRMTQCVSTHRTILFCDPATCSVERDPSQLFRGRLKALSTLEMLSDLHRVMSSVRDHTQHKHRIAKTLVVARNSKSTPLLATWPVDAFQSIAERS